MRYAFGLGGILITLGVVIWFMAAPGGELDEIKTAKDATDKVTPMLQQMGGKDENGQSAESSVSFQAKRDDSSHLQGLMAVNVVSGGAYETHYGLQDFDLITEAGPIDLKSTDEDSAKAYILDAYTKGGTLTVMRGNQKLTLPLPKSATAAPTAAASGNMDAQPAAPKTPERSGNPIQDQLNAIQQVPTH